MLGLGGWVGLVLVAASSSSSASVQARVADLGCQSEY